MSCSVLYRVSAIVARYQISQAHHLPRQLSRTKQTLVELHFSAALDARLHWFVEDVFKPDSSQKPYI